MKLKVLVTLVLLLMGGGGFYYLNTFYPGTLTIDWLGYNVVTTVPVTLVFVVTVFLLTLLIGKVIGKIISLPNMFSTYKNKKAHQKSCDQLWLAYQSIKLDGHPFPGKILEQLIKNHHVDSRIVLDLIITQKLIKHEELQVYVDQLKQLPFTEPTLLYAEINQLQQNNKLDECLLLYPKLFDLTQSSVIKLNYLQTLIKQAAQFAEHQNFDKTYHLLQNCDPAFLVLNDINLYGQFGYLMSHYFNHYQKYKHAQQMIEKTWQHYQILSLFECYKIAMHNLTKLDDLEIAQRLVSFASGSAVSYQIIIEGALSVGKLDAAHNSLNQLQSHFPHHPLVSFYQNKF